MIALPNGCSRSNIIIIPKNWRSNKASTKRDWLIQYRFYDPHYKGTKDWGKDIPVKGMNRFKILADRQEVTEALLNDELERLSQGWNPIVKEFIIPQESKFAADIDPSTPFIEALKLAEPKVETVPRVHDDMKSILKAVEKACNKLFDQRNRKAYKDLPIEKIDSRHLIFVLEQCQKDNEKMSDKRYNKYVAYLSMIFNKLKSLQAVESNPVDNMDKKKTVTRKRLILTDQEFKRVSEHLHKKDYYYWRYMMIFFHSVSRNTEMRELKKGPGVNIDAQEFTVTVLKGSQYEEQTRVINKNVVHLWRQIWDEAKEGEYLFGRDFKPGLKQSEKAVSKLWQDYVKIELGINKDWYSLKHKYEDMIDKMLSLKHAQDAAGHKSSRTTKIYTVGADMRRREELKDLDIALTG